MRARLALAACVASLQIACAGATTREEHFCGDLGTAVDAFAGDIVDLDVWGVEQKFIEISLANHGSTPLSLSASRGSGIVVHRGSFEVQRLWPDDWGPAVVVIEELAPPERFIVVPPNSNLSVYVGIDGIATDPRRDPASNYRVRIKTVSGCLIDSTQFGIPLPR